MSITVCVVCGDSAEKAYPVGSFDEFKCSNCGYYSVDRQLIDEMEAAGQVFDTERTQQYLMIHSQPGQVPAITRIETTKHQLIVESV
ncbi:MULTISPECIES: hypothetical protein [Gammaproteobacteria]|uniref:Uncharacterized protein n=2 Tax=Pseudomonas TaxID=286 RepID=A0A423IEF0_9PSED|nr:MULTISPECIES: hypothetical protein [Gammaproteobacteria]MBK5301899.1 hypothetical protein [Bacillus sp. TH86]MBK5321668.1 hypothetical protein [Bacillus sp. TH59]MBK5336618.1 hypothetical protein [Bacillus sp. TH57]MBK5310683.1 hypothetical protein [Pseudomonas sp. TH71]MBK5316165.1 hypothetical protein [Erwinia sp. TH79]